MPPPPPAPEGRKHLLLLLSAMEWELEWGGEGGTATFFRGLWDEGSRSRREEERERERDGSHSKLSGIAAVVPPSFPPPPFPPTSFPSAGFAKFSRIKKLPSIVTLKNGPSFCSKDL